MTPKRQILKKSIFLKTSENLEKKQKFTGKFTNMAKMTTKLSPKCSN
jgi:hypothetical protein